MIKAESIDKLKFSSIYTIVLQLQPVIFSVVVAAVLLLSIFFITPYWMSNDDVGMMMRAHGYGSFDHGSANLIFSNVLWGHVVRAFPSIKGVLGYSLSTYTLLSVAAGFSCWFLIRLGTGFFIAAILIFSTLFLAFVTPQFTLTSGFSAVTAALALRCYVDLKNIKYLIVFIIFSVFSFLVRWNEFLFIALISVPLLLNTSICRDRRFWLALCVLTVLLSVANVIDKQSYNEQGWKEFKEFNDARVPFSDYGLADKLSGTQSAQNLGYSNNDLQLLKMWFFVDENIAAPHLLRELKNSVLEDGSGSFLGGFDRGFASVANVFGQDATSWFAFMIMLMLVVIRSWRVLFAVAVLIFLLFYTGYIGRPTPVRVFYPGLALILFFAFCSISKKIDRVLIGFLVLMLIVFSSIAVYDVMGRQKQKHQLGTVYRQDYLAIPHGLFMTWGAYFPYEYIYTPLDREAHQKKIDFYSLGSSTLAPTSKAYKVESEIGAGLVNRLLSAEGINFVGLLGSELPDEGLHLSIYCAERHSAKFQSNLVSAYSALGVVNIRCIKD